MSTALTDLFVDGEWRSSDSGERFDVLDPASGSTIASVASASTTDALAAVDAAANAALAWRRSAPRDRAEMLRTAFELMRARRESIAELIVRENGKPLADALSEADYAAEFFRWYSEEAVRIQGTVARAPSGANDVMVTHEPVGVCVLVTPWNFPAAMATRKIGPALAAGCTVVLKPASDTPLTGLLLASLLAEAGVPDGVINVLPSRRSGAVVDAMLADPRVRKLSFTGSTEVGRTLLARAGAHVVNCSMELGGNAPFLVFADADLDAAVAGALQAKMRNVGQACTAANRFYVEASVADEFTRRLAAEMSSMPVGCGLDEGVLVGPLINDAACENLDRLVGDATGTGATAVIGGHRLARGGSFYAPTVLSDVSPEAAILHEEAFGPVAPVISFTDTDEVINAANDTEYGLVAYIYTSDLQHGLEVGAALEAGMIGLNRGVVSDPAAPFGGVKQSGIGREGGHEGVLDYTESKYFAIGRRGAGPRLLRHAV